MHKQSGLVVASILSLWAGAAWAQFPASPPPPLHRFVDSNGVDLISGAFVTNDAMVSIGPAGTGQMSRIYYNNGAWDNYTGAINSSGSTYTVSIGDRSEIFTLSGTTFTNAQGGGSTLTITTGGPFGTIYTYTAADGTVGIFPAVWAGAYPTQANVARLTSLTSPNGEALIYNYETVNLASSGAAVNAQRLQSVTNNYGYQIKYNYSASSGPAADTLTSIAGINNAVDYCNPTADTCSGLTVAWPTANYTTYNPSGGAYSWTDPMGLTTNYTPTSVQTHGGVQLTMVLNAAGQVTSLNNPYGTTTYSYVDSGGVRTTTVTDANTHVRVVTSNIANQTVLSDKDGNSHTTSFSYDSLNRLQTVTRPLGNATTFAYDGRGNVTSTTNTPVPGSGLANIITYAGYDTTCANPVKCNKPNFTTDALGYETDYSYNATYGVLLNVTAPAPTTGAVRPQTRYIYSGQSAYIKNASGAFIAEPPIHALAYTSQCVTTSSCSGTSDEVASYIVRGTTGVANNLEPTSVTQYAGDDSLYATTTLSWDSFGNPYTVTSPLGAPYTTRYHYDLDQRLIGVVGPDPDGSGPLLNRATRWDYVPLTGLLSQVEQGTVLSQSDADWANFSGLTATAYSYDSFANVASQLATSGSTSYTLTQFSHDLVGNLQCATVRLALSTAPTTCTAVATTISTDGPDRTDRRTYDGANQLLTETVSAQATPNFARTQTFTWTANGKLSTAADEKNNLTTYQYDGFDRLTAIYYPSPTTPGTSSTTDYEQYTYDADSRITAVRRRNGASISIGYDYDSRPTNALNSATLAYDNLNRLLSQTLFGAVDSYTYDALSRITAQGQPHGTVQTQFDLSGRRTQLTWPDGYYVTYTYDYADDLTGLGENGPASGPTVISNFTFDNLGRRTSITRPNAITTAYGYDGASRLTSLSHAGTTNSADVSFGYGYDAASELTTRTSSNAGYDWTTAAAAQSYAANGLNQLTTAGSTSLSYDSLGDLTSDGTHSYSYNNLSQLTGVGSNIFGYDAAGRLSGIIDASPVSFLYDGQDIIAEYNSSSQLLRRITFGPGTDESLYWVDATSDTEREWMLADERGSIIGLANSTGAVWENRYDAYGAPASSNLGLFMYEGQFWLSDAAAYSFKNRNYHPGLGRFMQTDPIGWAGGANLYRFAGNDPVNGADPLGLDGDPVQTVVVTATKRYDDWISSFIGANLGGLLPTTIGPTINVIGRRPNYISRAPGLKLLTQQGPQNNQISKECTAARTVLGNLGKQLSGYGSAFTWGGVGLIGVSGAGAIFAPEAFPVEAGGGEAGVGLVEFGGAASTLGNGLQEYGRSGSVGRGISASAISFGIDKITGGVAGQALRGLPRSTQSAVASLLGQIPDAFQKEEAACGGGG